MSISSPAVTLDADALHSLTDVIEGEFGPGAVASLASTCIALWRGHVFRLENGSGPHALKGRLDLLRRQRIDALAKKLECEDVLSLLRSSPDLYKFGLVPSDARMIASLYLHDLRGEVNGKSISFDRGNRVPPQLPIDELMGVKAVDSLDFSCKGLGPASAVVIAVLISDNASLTSINLARNMLGLEGAKALAPALRDSPSITSIGKDGLNLRDNRLGNEGWGAIFAAVCSSEASKITSIDASCEGVGSKGAELIAEALRTSVNPSLTSIDLSWSIISEESKALLRKAVEGRSGFELRGID